MQSIPIPPIDLSQVPPWLISSATLIGILTLIVLPLLTWLSGKVTWLKQLGDLGLYVIAGLVGLVLYWAGTFLGGVLAANPDLTKQLQPYWQGVPVLLVIMTGLWAVRIGVRGAKTVASGIKTIYSNWHRQREARLAMELSLRTGQVPAPEHTGAYLLPRTG